MLLDISYLTLLAFCGAQPGILRFCFVALPTLCGAAQPDIPRPAPQYDNVQDLLGLSALYKSTGGENTWYHKSRWMSDDPDCRTIRFEHIKLRSMFQTQKLHM